MAQATQRPVRAGCAADPLALVTRAAGAGRKRGAKAAGQVLIGYNPLVSGPLEYPACPYPAPLPAVPLPLFVVPEHPCPYLPGRRCRSRALFAGELSGADYQVLMDAAFRRSGRVVYQPICRGCRACLSLRVPVHEFRPSRSQRRCQRRNADLSITVAPPEPTEERYELYCRYLAARHQGPMNEDSWESFVAFLYDSPVETLEFCYRDSAGRLLAVGICDLCPDSLSSVYFYFDPEPARRGLGTFGSLYEIETTRRLGRRWYYLGYWVEGCRSMQYKAQFRPHELLGPEGRWQRIE